MSALPFRAMVAAFAASAISLFASRAAARTDGAGLFALPPERVAAADRSEPPGRAWPRRRLAGEIRAIVSILMRFREFGYTPMILGCRGFGVRRSGPSEGRLNRSAPAGGASGASSALSAALRYRPGRRGRKSNDLADVNKIRTLQDWFSPVDIGLAQLT